MCTSGHDDRSIGTQRIAGEGPINMEGGDTASLVQIPESQGSIRSGSEGRVCASLQETLGDWPWVGQGLERLAALRIPQGKLPRSCRCQGPVASGAQGTPPDGIRIGQGLERLAALRIPQGEGVIIGHDQCAAPIRTKRTIAEKAPHREADQLGATTGGPDRQHPRSSCRQRQVPMAAQGTLGDWCQMG